VKCGKYNACQDHKCPEIIHMYLSGFSFILFLYIAIYVPLFI